MKERILLIHNYYQIGGGEHTVFENEKRLLSENGHYVAEYIRDNKELESSLRKKLLLPFTVIFSLKTYRDIKRIIRDEKIDLVHCHNTFPLISPSVYYAARKCNIPVIQTIHNFRLICANAVLSRNGKPCEDCLKNGLRCALKHKCYRQSGIQTLVLINMLRVHRMLGTYKKVRYIFLTEFNKEKFRGLLGDWLEHQFIKPNFEHIEMDSDEENRGNSYVFIGRLEKDKGIDFLLEAWKEERNRDLYIFGNGVLQEIVEKACNENDRIHLMGFQPKEVVLKYLRKAKAMLFPTDLYEGFPMTIIESFAMGTPVVCSDIGNGADIVRKHDAGVPYKSRDVDALWQAILKTDRDFEKYSSAAKNAYKNNYTPDINYEQLMKIYDRILSEQQPKAI